MGAIDRYGTLVVDPMVVDDIGVQLANKPLLGLIIEGAGTFGIEVSIDGGTTWFAMDPAVSVSAGAAISSSELAPLAAYCIQPVRVQLDSYTGATAVTWVCSG